MHIKFNEEEEERMVKMGDEITAILQKYTSSVTDILLVKTVADSLQAAIVDVLAQYTQKYNEMYKGDAKNE